MWKSMMCCSPCYRRSSLRSKRFRLVTEQERPCNGIFGFGRAKKVTRVKKWKRGERKEGNAFPYFLSHPLPVLLLAPIWFDSRSSFLAPKPNGKLATQAIVTANAQLSSDIYSAVYSPSSTIRLYSTFQRWFAFFQCKDRGIWNRRQQ